MKLKRIFKKLGLSALASIFLLSAAGCSDEELNIIPSPKPTLEATLNPVPTLTQTPVQTPELTPEITASPEPTKTIDPLGLNTYEDIFNEEVVNYETQRLIDNYFETTFFYHKSSAEWDDMVNIIKWRGIPNGKIDKENLEATLLSVFVPLFEENHEFSRLYKGEITIDEENLILFNLEPAFINNSKAEEVYLNLLKMRYDMFKYTANGKYEEIAQTTLNYIYTDFVLNNKIFEGIEGPDSAYDKIILLYEIDYLCALSAKFDAVSKVYDENGNSVDIFSDEFIWAYFDTYDLLYSQLIDEIISSKGRC